MGSNLEDILKQGIAVHREGKLQEAETFYRAILKSQPMHPDANHNLGVLAVNVGKVAEALPYFKIALEENPNIEQYWVSYIEVLFQLGQVAEARQKLSQGARFGLTHGKIREIEKRLNNQLPITKAININAHIDENQLRQLISMYQNGNLKQALTLANNLKKKFTNNVTLENIIGSIHFASGNYDEAVNTYENLKQVAPNLPEIHYNLANALTGLEKYKEAKENYYKAIELRPDYADAYNNLGINYATCNEHDKAIVNFKKALGLKPDLAQAWLRLGVTFFQNDEPRNAVIVFKKTINLQPVYGEAYYNRGIALLCFDRLQEAILDFKKVAELLPENAEAYFNIGNILKNQGIYNEAISNYSKALSSRPNYTDVHINLGNTFFKLRDYRKALKHFKVVNTAQSEARCLECLYIMKEYEEYHDRLNSLARLDNKNINVAAISAFVAHQLKQDDPYGFCKNPLDFFYCGSLKNHTPNLAIFLNHLISESEKSALVWEPKDKTTVSGFQSSANTFEQGAPFSLLEKYLLKEIKKYHSRFLGENCSFMQFWPKKFKLYGWYVRLTQNGHQEAHIHPNGWVSGVVYLKTVNSKDTKNGAIELGLHGYNLPIIDKNYPRKVHHPKNGQIILFPSSLFHKTYPFIEEVDRCVIAFDLHPAN